MGLAWLGSARLGSARLGSARLCPPSYLTFHFSLFSFAFLILFLFLFLFLFLTLIKAPTNVASSFANYPGFLKFTFFARTFSIIKYKTRHRKRQDRTHYQLHTKMQDMLLNNMDFKNPVLCLIRVRLRLGYV